VQPIRRTENRPSTSPRPWLRRTLVVVVGVLLALAASACSGSTAPEPGEHETKHDDVIETLRAASVLPVPPGAVTAGAVTVVRP